MTTPRTAKPDDVSGGKALIEKLKNASLPDQNGCRLFTADLTREAAEALTAASERIWVLEGALKPFAACVYNDNGAVTFDKSSITNDDYWRAYRAHRAAPHAEPDRSGG